MVPSDIVGSFSEATMRRGARDRRGLRGEEHRRGQGHRAKRCGYTQILSSGTSIAKEYVGTGVGETGGKRLTDAMSKAGKSCYQVDGVTQIFRGLSGGARELGQEGLDEFCEIKHVHREFAAAPTSWWYPYGK
jgi:hypothetical protein